MYFNIQMFYISQYVLFPMIYIIGSISRKSGNYRFHQVLFKSLLKYRRHVDIIIYFLNSLIFNIFSILVSHSRSEPNQILAFNPFNHRNHSPCFCQNTISRCSNESTVQSNLIQSDQIRTFHQSSPDV